MLFRSRGATYHIHVDNPAGVMKGRAVISLDGENVERIPAGEPGSVHEVRVILQAAETR